MKLIYLFPGKIAVSREPAEITTILGSCVAVALWDPSSKIGGLNHYLLATTPSGERASARYGDYALQELLDSVVKLGANPKTIQAKVFGGAAVLSALSSGVGIGKRNIEVALQFLESNRIRVIENNTGGTSGRSIKLYTETFKIDHQFSAQTAKTPARETNKQVNGLSEAALKFGVGLDAFQEEIDVSGFEKLNIAKHVKVLIVDDSVTVRNMFSKIFTRAGLEVVGIAANAYEARNIIVEKKPDVMTLDIEMPGVNGVNFLEKIMRHAPMPVVMVSSLGADGQAALRSLELGAIEFIQKPSQFDPSALAQFGDLVVNKVRAAASINLLKHLKKNSIQKAAAPSSIQSSNKKRGELKVITIGGNVGSTETLQLLLSGLPADTPPVVVANSTITPFLESFLSKIKSKVKIDLLIAKDQMLLKPGTVYFAPSFSHIYLTKIGGQFSLQLKAGPPINGQLPSSSALFESAAQAAGPHALGVLLGGFGSDGVQGLIRLDAAGSTTFVEHPEQASFPYAPQKAIAEGVVDQILVPSEIAKNIFEERTRRVIAA